MPVRAFMPQQRAVWQGADAQDTLPPKTQESAMKTIARVIR